MTVTFVFEVADQPLDDAYYCTVALTDSLASAFLWARVIFCRSCGDEDLSDAWYYHHHVRRVWLSLRQSERQPLDLILYHSYI